MEKVPSKSLKSRPPTRVSPNDGAHKRLTKRYPYACYMNVIGFQSKAIFIMRYLSSISVLEATVQLIQSTVVRAKVGYYDNVQTR